MLKVLRVPHWLNWDNDPDDELMTVSAVRGLIKEGRFVPMSPIFNRDGLYYDTKTKKCWIECKTGCFEITEKDFFRNEFFFKSEPLLTNKVKRAIAIVLEYNLNIPIVNKGLRKLMYEEDIIRGIKDVFWGHVVCHWPKIGGIELREGDKNGSENKEQ